MNYMNKRPASLNGCGHERFAVVGAIQTFPHGHFKCGCTFRPIR
jgi:hypothetical protein